MQSKIKSHWLLSVAGILVFIILLATALSSLGFTLPEAVFAEGINSGYPSRIKIPSIGLDTNIVSVGETPDGAMGSPKGPVEVAWYNLGPKPGKAGSAVLAGHSGWKNNIRSAFDDLNKLQTGDRIYIQDKKKKTVTFIVREVRTYDAKAQTQEVFGSIDGGSHLNLITCAGVWNKEIKSSPNRLVVFADKI